MQPGQRHELHLRSTKTRGINCAKSARNLLLIEILLPVFDNAGRKFGSELYDNVRKQMTKCFGGVTAFTRVPALGEVKDSAAIVHDDIIVLEVMADAIDRVPWRDFSKALEKTFAPDEIVIRAVQFEWL